MIVDIHVHVSPTQSGVWNNPAFPIERLIEIMDGPFEVFGKPRQVERAVLMPQVGETVVEPDFEKQHLYVTEAVARHPERFFGCFMINPHFGVERAVSLLPDLVLRRGYRMVKLHPTQHGYMPSRVAKWLSPIAAVAGELGVPVLIHTGDPPFGIPANMVPLIEACPRTTFILAHLATQNVCYAADAINVAKQYPNVYLETGCGSLPRLKDAVGALGAGRLVFGTDCPFSEIGSEMRNIQALTWEPPVGVEMSVDAAEGVLGGNAMMLLAQCSGGRVR